MTDLLQFIDNQLFYFFNDSIKNPVFDWLMPFITNQKNWYPFFALVIIGLLWKGGKKGRIATLLLIFVITLADQFSASFLKNLIARPRPCIALDNVHALIGYKTSFSMPSAHAANSFAAAFFFSFYYRKYSWIYFILASLVGLSRIYVGVHYTFDVLAGALVGLFCAYTVIGAWNVLLLLFNKILHYKNFLPDEEHANEANAG